MSINVLRGAAGLAFAVGLGLLIYGFAFSGGDSNDAQAAQVSTATPATSATQEPSATSTPRNTSTPAPSPTETEIPTPTATPHDGAVAAMRIPRFNVDAAVEDIGIDSNNRLQTPHNPLDVGWYGIYKKPGWGLNSVFSAHVDYYPSTRGPFYNLADMELGDEVVVVMDNGLEYRYRVISNTQWTVENIPTGDLINAPDRPREDEWITLITCGGDFVPYNGYNGPGYYKHRDVVIAERFQ